MSELTQAEAYLLDQVRAGEAQGWAELVERYQGRLVAFAQGKVGRRADAEDLVQDTFVAFLRGLERYRGEAGLETYLFTILRRKVIDAYRSRGAEKVCLLGDVTRGEDESGAGDAWRQVAGRGQTASWYARREEGTEQRRAALAGALRELVEGLRQSGKLRELEVAELLFYCQVGNKEAAEAVGLDAGHVGVMKHRWLGQIREGVAGEALGEMEEGQLESLLTQVWEEGRLSCPKRSTIGAWVLGTLEEEWGQYVGFHVERLGCGFCRANWEDLKRQTAQAEAAGALRERILESTVGFLR